jgi:teichoic acid transport system ATP-binding protein
LDVSLIPIPLAAAPVVASPQGKLLLEAVNIGVKYELGRKREDLQSLTYGIFSRRHRQKPEVRWALQEVNMTAAAGEVIGIIGGNGAGKTTLCRAICGLLRPDTGSLHIAGTVSTLLSLGVGFQAELSGRDNILLNGMMLGVSRRALSTALPDIVEFAGLGRFIDQPLKHYSSGMRARLGFSVATALDPDILIIDEALSVGDLEFSEKAGRKMRELAEKAKLVVVVTHQLSFVERYCSRALWLANGRVKASGDAAEVVRAYTDSIPKAGAYQKAAALVAAPIPDLIPPPPGAPVIEVRDLSVQFTLRASTTPTTTGVSAFLPTLRRTENDQFWALRDLTLTVNEGEIVGIIGPNGAGKTTLCQALSGILHADQGEIVLRGALTALLTFGTGFHEQLTGRDNVYLNGMMMGIPKWRLDEVYDEIVNFSELARMIDEPVKHYSRGMRVRLGFSVATAINPDLLILDEALNVGDIAFYEKASRKIRDLIEAAKAVMVVTHNLAFVEQVCTRAIWLKNGTLQFDGAPKEAVAAYRQSLKK